MPFPQLQQLSAAVRCPPAALMLSGACAALACARDFEARLRAGGRKLAGILSRRPAGTRPLQPRLACEAQWARVVRVVEDQLSRAQRAAEYHAAACFSLDASEYELRRLREDLGPLFAPPAGVLTLVAARPAPVPARQRVALAA